MMFHDLVQLLKQRRIANTLHVDTNYAIYWETSDNVKKTLTFEKFGKIFLKT